MLNGKKTVKLKDLKEPKENIMKNTITENKTLNVTNSGFNKLNNLSMKRKWGTQQRCYRNNCKKRETEISEDCVLKVCFDESQHMFFSVSVEFQIITVTVIIYILLLLYSSR